jgi:hypothetical protein
VVVVAAVITRCGASGGCDAWTVLVVSTATGVWLAAVGGALGGAVQAKTKAATANDQSDMGPISMQPEVWRKCPDSLRPRR